MDVMNVLRNIFLFLIFPGFFFTAIIGLVSTWVDRKVTALVQWRKGPPFLQPFYDVVKLLGKETILPKNGNSFVFLAAPVLGIVCVSIVSSILWTSNIYGTSFVGDLIVVIYLITVPSIALIIGGSASGNPLASHGAGREMKLILAYELPFLLCIAVVVLKADGSIRIADLMRTPLTGSVSGVIAFIVGILVVQAKLGFVPFDIAEAETEIIAGPYIEYSGPPLSLFKMTQAMMLFTLPVLLVTLFLGGFSFIGLEILWSILKFILILVVIIVIKNTNPRIRIDQAMNFFWFGCGIISLIALGLAIAGKIYQIPWL
ncbi:MAG: NADH-quinone oxidoreductase subunit H [Spirochaetales bacterium]|nr:NADH-quinone oxidoreductase subunit H [Spirochaetales bacterium]